MRLVQFGEICWQVRPDELQNVRGMRSLSFEDISVMCIYHRRFTGYRSRELPLSGKKGERRGITRTEGDKPLICLLDLKLLFHYLIPSSVGA